MDTLRVVRSIRKEEGAKRSGGPSEDQVRLPKAACGVKPHQEARDFSRERFTNLSYRKRGENNADI